MYIIIRSGPSAHPRRAEARGPRPVLGTRCTARLEVTGGAGPGRAGRGELVGGARGGGREQGGERRGEAGDGGRENPAGQPAGRGRRCPGRAGVQVRMKPATPRPAPMERGRFWRRMARSTRRARALGFVTAMVILS